MDLLAWPFTLYVECLATHCVSLSLSVSLFPIWTSLSRLCLRACLCDSLCISVCLCVSVCPHVCLCVAPSVDGATNSLPPAALAVHHGSHPIQRCTVGQLKARLCMCVSKETPQFLGPAPTPSALCSGAGVCTGGEGRCWVGVTPPTPPLKEILNTVSSLIGNP